MKTKDENSSWRNPRVTISVQISYQNQSPSIKPAHRKINLYCPRLQKNQTNSPIQVPVEVNCGLIAGTVPAYVESALKSFELRPTAAEWIEFLTTAVSDGSPTAMKGKTHACFGDGELKTVTYLRNDRSNCFLPMLYDTLFFPLHRADDRSRGGGFGKKQKRRKRVAKGGWNTRGN